MKGSVSYRDGPRGRSWFFRIDTGRDAGGRRRTKTRRGFPTRKAALTAMQKELHERRSGSYVDPSPEPLGAYLDRWLAATRQGRRPVTNRNYRNELARLPGGLRAIPLATLTALAIQEAEGELLLTYAPATVRQTHTILKMALAQAVRWRLLPHNPAAGVAPPHVSRSPLPTWTAAEARRFLAATREDPWHSLWRLLLDAGLRLGEARALRWADVDLDAALVTVRRTMTRAEDGRDLMGDDVKTPSGRRIIPVMEATVAALRAHRERQERQRRSIGPLWRDGDLVFCRDDGAPLSDAYLDPRLARAIAAADVPRLTHHGLRHTCGTLLILAGVPVKIVSERLGHRSVAFTLDRYVHPDASAGVQAVDALARVLGERQAELSARLTADVLEAISE